VTTAAKKVCAVLANVDRILVSICGGARRFIVRNAVHLNGDLLAPNVLRQSPVNSIGRPASRAFFEVPIEEQDSDVRATDGTKAWMPLVAVTDLKYQQHHRTIASSDVSVHVWPVDG
jgi:hypothetical protein